MTPPQILKKKKIKILVTKFAKNIKLYLLYISTLGELYQNELSFSTNLELPIFVYIFFLIILIIYYNENYNFLFKLYLTPFLPIN